MLLEIRNLHKERRTFCMLVCHECKNADKNLSSNSKNSNVFVLVKPAVKQRRQWGGTLDSYFQFWCCNNARWHQLLSCLWLFLAMVVPHSCFAGCRVLCAQLQHCLWDRVSSWLTSFWSQDTLLYLWLYRHTRTFCGHKVRENSSSLRQEIAT